MSCIFGIEQNCDECRMCMKEDRKQTNADRIRSMSVEEMAKEIAEKIECMNCPFVNEEGKCGEVECDELFLEWLQSEAEVGE